MSREDKRRQSCHDEKRLVDYARWHATEDRGNRFCPPVLGGGLRIGALVPNSDLAYHPLIAQRYPMLCSAILAGASAQLRNMAVCSSDVQWVVLGNNPIHNAVTERMSSSLLCLLDSLKA